MNKKVKVLVLISVLLVFSLGCQIFSGGSASSVLPPASALVEVTPQPLPQEASAPSDVAIIAEPASEELLVRLYQQVSPGVVAIQVLTRDGSGLGSGFVIDKEGHIVTNYHVIEGQTDLEVDFASGYKTRARAIGQDTDSDLAILKVEAPEGELHPLKLGDSSQLQVGQTVIAIGNPFGLTGTMTTGIVSALGRTLDSMRDAPGGDTFTAGDIIQTDTAINPGNSGGPLLNLRGEVIGVNRAIRTFNFTSGEEPLNSGIGFAVAINIIKRVAPALIATGTYDYPYLGITSLPEIGLLQQEALGLPRATGAYITSVTAGSPAERAGLRSGKQPTEFGSLAAGGDLIIAIDGSPIKTFGDLLAYLINNKSPGDSVTLTILRGDQQLDLDLTLDKRP